MKNPILVALFLLALIGVSSTKLQAVVYDSSIPIPDSEVIINFEGTGLDWVYAGPIATHEFASDNLYDPSYRAAEGWRFATAAEWALRPDWTDFTRPGYAIPSADAGYSNHTVYRFASEYWGGYSHVDLNDANAGLITNGKDIGSLHGVWETFYVRDSRGVSAPDSTTTLGLLFGALAALAFFRRR